MYICACICLHFEIWKHRCEHVRNNQSIHKHIHLTIYQSRHWRIGRYFDIIHVRLYLWNMYLKICTYMSQQYNWYTLKYLVLVRIKGLKTSPKIPGNTFSNALLKSRNPNFKKKPRFARFFLRSHGKTWCAPWIIFSFDFDNCCSKSVKDLVYLENTLLILVLVLWALV